MKLIASCLFMILAIFFFSRCQQPRPKQVPKPKLQAVVPGIWKLDSVWEYDKGQSRKLNLKDTYWEFNEFNDLVVFTPHTMLLVKHIIIEDSTIHEYEKEGGDTVITTLFTALTFDKAKIKLRGKGDDFAETIYMTKTGFKSNREVIEGR